jgi:hypothetical protein
MTHPMFQSSAEIAIKRDEAWSGMRKVQGPPRGRKAPIVATSIIAAVITIEMFLGSIRLGEHSLRIAFLSLLLVVAMTYVAARVRLGLTPIVHLIVALYACYVLWITLSIAMVDGPDAALLYVLPRHVLTIALFIVVIRIIAVTESRRVAALFICAVMVTSCFAALQSLGADWAWQVWEILRPVDYADWYDPRKQLPPGLAQGAFQASYHLVIGFGLILGFALQAQRLSSRLLALSLGALVAIGSVALQQRSVLLSLVAMLVTAGWLHLGSRSANQVSIDSRGMQRRPYRSLMLATMSIVLVAVIAAALSLGSQDASTEHRFADLLHDPGRTTFIAATIQNTRANPMTGSRHDFAERSQFKDHRPQELERSSTPHNLFLNAAILGGVPALVLLVLFVLAALISAARYLSRSSHADWSAVGAFLALVGYTVNSQFHNAGFALGDFLPWLLLSMVLVHFGVTPRVHRTAKGTSA